MHWHLKVSAVVLLCLITILHTISATNNKWRKMHEFFHLYSSQKSLVAFSCSKCYLIVSNLVMTTWSITRLYIDIKVERVDVYVLKWHCQGRCGIRVRENSGISKYRQILVFKNWRLKSKTTCSTNDTGKAGKILEDIKHMLAFS